nr:hypothetical protein BaRGS_025063 [Batillaria attramentaria]
MRVKGLAEVLDLRTCTVQEMTAAILKVARDPSYKHAITAASRLFRQQFHVPVEVGARWLDHVMKYGGAYMRSAVSKTESKYFVEMRDPEDHGILINTESKQVLYLLDTR